MKYPSSQEHNQEVEGGSCGNCEEYALVTIRQKRLKVEPLSPPSVNSDDDEDEESSLSSWSDQELSQTLLTKIGEANVQAQSVKPTELTEQEEVSESETSEGDSLTDDDCEELEEDSGAEHATPRKQARIPTRLTPSKMAMVASTITSTTPPQTPAPQETETAIPDTTILSDADDETNQGQCHDNKSSSTDENCCPLRHQQPQVYRYNLLTSPPISRAGRGGNTKLSEEQHEQLKKIFRIIEEGHFEELRRLLEKKEGQTNLKRNILNVFVRGDTALHHALRLGRGLAWCKLLVANGANPTLTNQAGWHPIHLAAHNGTRETMSYIIGFAESE